MIFKVLLFSVAQSYTAKSSQTLSTELTANHLVVGQTILERINGFNQGKCAQICGFIALEGRDSCWNRKTHTCNIPEHRTRIATGANSHISSFQMKNRHDCQSLCRLTPGCFFWSYHHKYNHSANGYCSLVEDAREIIDCRVLKCTCGVNPRPEAPFRYVKTNHQIGNRSFLKDVAEFVWKYFGLYYR